MLGLNSLQCGIFKLKVAKCVLSLYMKGYFHTSIFDNFSSQICWNICYIFQYVGGLSENQVFYSR